MFLRPWGPSQERPLRDPVRSAFATNTSGSGQRSCGHGRGGCARPGLPQQPDRGPGSARGADGADATTPGPRAARPERPDVQDAEPSAGARWPGPGSRSNLTAPVRPGRAAGQEAAAPARPCAPAYLVDGGARVRPRAQRGHPVPVVGARPGGGGAGARPQGTPQRGPHGGGCSGGGTRGPAPSPGPQPTSRGPPGTWLCAPPLIGRRCVPRPRTQPIKGRGRPREIRSHREPRHAEGPGAERLPRGRAPRPPCPARPGSWLCAVSFFACGRAAGLQKLVPYGSRQPDARCPGCPAP